MVAPLPTFRTAAHAPPPPLPPVRPTPRVRARSVLWRLRFLLAAACLGAAAGVVVQAVRPPPPATVPVVVLTRDVVAGTTLGASDLAVVDVPPGVAPAHAPAGTGHVEGRVVVVDLPARTPVAPSLLAGTTLAGPPGRVVVAVRLDDPGVSALLEPGLHLDLVAARPEGGPGETVARRALVRPTPVREQAADGLLGGASADDGPPVLVAVTPEEAVRIAEASASSRLVAVIVP